MTKKFASLKSSLLKKSRFRIRLAALCFSLCFEGKCFENRFTSLRDFIRFLVIIIGVC